MSRKKRDRQRRETKLAKSYAKRLAEGAEAIDKLTARRVPCLPNGKIGNAVYVEVPMPEKQ